MGLLKNGYEAFNTAEEDFNDGEEHCSATLFTYDNTTNTEGQFTGTTKEELGHGEIAALYKFLKSINWDVNVFRNYNVTISCTAKPCCKYCAAVMGLLNISPGVDTCKIWKHMGISYALPPDIRKFLSRYLGVKLSVIEEELQG